ncbi:DUF2829 domain-containing protein [Rhizobium laguerreae]|uniref:Thoeris anti-defense Tad2 family protein n=1 Tax=Rhizobium laguerreae TaxID=1076926 RepID=UPI001C919564|nr:MW1434 family type I TA system toxin [Rhizobium laguerreae]MBY3263900.1 DUF2829 domain-containing protein [Rhizobium laguerreae]
MNYGQAIEAMKIGGAARRRRGTCVQLVHRGTPLQYLEITDEDGRRPYVPSTDDQLADDWNVSARWREAA